MEITGNMNKIFLIFSTLLGVASADAQIYSKSQLTTANNTTITTNGAEQITGSVLNTYNNQIIGSFCGLFQASDCVLPAGVAIANLGFTPLKPSNNLSDLNSTSTARTNLGLGTMAMANFSSNNTFTGANVISPSGSLTVQGPFTATGSVTLPAGTAATNLGFIPLKPSNNLSELTNVMTAKQNLGLGVSNVVLHVDNVSGTDSNTCGATTGSGACASVQQAYLNLCENYYPLNNVPTIQLTAGQTYSSGLAIAGGASDNAPPMCVGISQLILDGQVSTISMSGIPVYLRYAPMGVSLRRLTLISSASSDVVVRGAGMVNLEDGIILGGSASNYPELLAYGAGQIATCPTSTCSLNTVLTISGGGESFAQEISGGSIQIEGVPVVITGTPTFTQGFVNVTQNGSVSFFQASISGAIVGDQFFGSKLGLVDINGQTGSYSTCSDTYLPGSICGQLYSGARISEAGYATVSGCGTGATVQNMEPYFNILLGSGLASTNGTAVTSCRVTMATRSNYTSCIAIPANGGAETVLTNSFVSPTSSANGYVNLQWIANGYSPTGNGIYISCSN